MNAADLTDADRRWFPICGDHDLPPQHVFETELLGQELAVWRGSGGRVNVWENRCPHRGSRFSIGANLGDELRCAYHGYRFAQESGLCTVVPAQPGRAAPRSLCAKVFPVLERGGLIWTRLASDESAVDPPPLIARPALALYSVAVAASALDVGELLAGYRFRHCAALGDQESAGDHCETAAIDAYRFRSVATHQDLDNEVLLFTQPVDPQCTVLHGILRGEVDEAQRLATLRHHAAQFTRVRSAAERRDTAAAARPISSGGRNAGGGAAA